MESYFYLYKMCTVYVIYMNISHICEVKPLVLTSSHAQETQTKKIPVLGTITSFQMAGQDHVGEFQ